MSACYVFFFFSSRRRHTRLQGDWSSDVCSSDLLTQATAARLSQESAAARDMIDRYYERYGRRPMGVAADNTYGNGELLQWLDDRGITPYIRVKEGPNSPPDLYGIEKFTYVPEENCYLCPAGKPLNYVGINKRNRAHRYYSTVKRSEEHTSELQSPCNLVCRLLLEKKKK